MSTLRRRRAFQPVKVSRGRNTAQAAVPHALRTFCATGGRSVAADPQTTTAVLNWGVPATGVRTAVPWTCALPSAHVTYGPALASPTCATSSPGTVSPGTGLWILGAAAPARLIVTVSRSVAPGPVRIGEKAFSAATSTTSSLTNATYGGDPDGISS